MRIYKEITEIITLIYRKARLVHGDLSEYNIMIFEGKPVVIDVSQAVSIDHPNARSFLEQDLKNITRFFAKAGVEVEDPADLLGDILSSPL
jgi:RIO kinase 1